MKKRTFHAILLKLAVITSVLSQIGALGAIFRPAMYTIWLVVIAIGLIDQKLKIELTSFAYKYVKLYPIWLIICMVAAIFGENHLSGNYLRIVLVPALVTITANLYKDDMTPQIILSLRKVYVICALCFAAWVHMTYFPSYLSWLRMNVYAYAQKNSAAQIWCSSILIVAFVIKPKTKLGRFLWYSVAAYLLVISALSQCRTALWAIGFAGLVYVIKYTRYRVAVILFCFFNRPFCMEQPNNTTVRQPDISYR